MHPFAAGDLVICIDDEPVPGRIIRIGEPWVKAGRAYRISCVSTNEIGEHGVVLSELRHWPPGAGWHAWRFRKFEAADEEFTRSLVRVKEDA